MSQPILLPKYHSLFIFHFISSRNDSPCWLPGHTRTHVLSAFFCHRLHQSLRSIALWRTYKWIHHFVSCNRFSTLLGLDVQVEKVSIRSPRESGIVGQCLLVLIKGYLVYQIELCVELDYSTVFGDHIQVLLGGGKGGSSDTVLIFSLNLDYRI